MLNRTKVSSAAIGVLAILLLLLSVSQGVPVDIEVPVLAGSETLEDSNSSPSEIADEPNSPTTVEVGDLPFAGNLLNPCPSDPPAGRPGTLVAEERRAEFAVEFYRTISDNSNRYRQDAQRMLDQNIIHECVSLNVPNLQNTPTLEELQGMDPSEALVVIYASILQHTAHAYFIRHQHRTYANISCSDVIDNESIISQKSGELAVKQKFLACIIRMGAAAMGYPHNYNNIAQEVLQEKLTNLKLCSRRALRDCQVLRSTIHLLDVVHSYSTRETGEESW